MPLQEEDVAYGVQPDLLILKLRLVSQRMPFHLQGVIIVEMSEGLSEVADARPSDLDFIPMGKWLPSRRMPALQGTSHVGCPGARERLRRFRRNYLH